MPTEAFDNFAKHVRPTWDRPGHFITQNCDTQTVHPKLDELRCGVQGARNSLIDLENLSDQKLEVLHQQFLGAARRISGNGSIIEVAQPLQGMIKQSAGRSGWPYGARLDHRK